MMVKQDVWEAYMMKLERLSPNQLKFSFSFDELEHVGISDGNFWDDVTLWQDVFEDMMEKAYQMLDVPSMGTVSIELASFTQKEVVLILTIEDLDSFLDEWTSFHQDNDLINPFQKACYQFRTLEDVLSLAQRINQSKVMVDGSLYYYEKQYYIMISKHVPQAAKSLFEEYGDQSSLASAIIEEYGTLVLPKQCFQQLVLHFFG
jgi:adapter protein MecA 1/2